MVIHHQELIRLVARPGRFAVRLHNLNGYNSCTKKDISVGDHSKVQSNYQEKVYYYTVALPPCTQGTYYFPSQNTKNYESSYNVNKA